MNKVEFIEEFSKDDFKLAHEATKVAVLTDENTLEYCYPLVEQFLPENHYVITVKSGEVNKNLKTCQYIWDRLTSFGFDRKSLMINLGGGVIGDMGGFCAATYKRGVSFIQVPTTLLSQVDASVGGKLGVDFQGLKNHIGVFQIPDMVLINPVFIKTLSSREVRSGYAEVIKHALIADAAHWDVLKTKAIADLKWLGIIKHSVAIKSGVVESDPTEKGLRKILNFGHTIGHAFESYLLENPSRKLLHGEAIAIGMICEAFISKERGGLSQAELEEISAYILQVYGKPEIVKDDVDALGPLMLQDKKNEGGEIQCALLGQLGKASFNDIVTWDEVLITIDYYIAL